MQGRQEYQPKLFSIVDFEQLIPKHHFLRKVDKILDLSFVRKLTKDHYCMDNGRPSIDPELFFRLVLIGYFYGISSDRQLCEEAQYNLAYRWFCRLSLEDAIPNHSSMTRIRDRLGEEIFKRVFEEVVELCQRHGLVEGTKVLTDATLIKANASLESMVRRDGQPEEVKEEESNRGSKGGPGPPMRRTISNKTHISNTDPDSSLAHRKNQTRALKYKVHTTIDSKHRIILDNQVTSGNVPEHRSYVKRVQHVAKRFGISIKEAIADRGYGVGEVLSDLEKMEITPWIPLFNQYSGSAEPEPESGFIFEEKNNRYVCPEGKHLHPLGKPHDGRQLYRALGGKTCFVCPKESTCLPKNAGRRKRRPKIIYRNAHQPAFKRILAKMATPEFLRRMNERMWKMEGLMAEAKSRHGLHQAKYRGRSKVQIQAYMTATVQNLKRLAHHHPLFLQIYFRWFLRIKNAFA